MIISLITFLFILLFLAIVNKCYNDNIEDIKRELAILNGIDLVQIPCWWDNTTER